MSAARGKKILDTMSLLRFWNMDFRIHLIYSILITLLVCGSEADVADESNDISSDPLSAIHSLIRQARTESGNLDLDSLLSQNVQDPVPLENFNVSTKGFLTDLNGRFTSLQLHGLRSFTLQRLAIDLSAMNLSAIMEVPALAIVGDYFLDGTVTFFPISGEGPFYMNLTTILLRGHSIVRSTPEGRLSTGDVVLDCDVGGAAVHFENLMGGGAWGSISNSLLNQLSELILGELKPTLLRELSSYLKWQFDEVLFARLPEGFVDPAATNLMDSVLERSAGFMGERGMEPMPLPDYKEVFERRVFFVTTRGELEFYNGSLHGLSTLRRKGEVVTVLENNTLVFEAEFEFQNLTGSYHWSAEAFGADTRGRMDLQVTSVEGFVRIRLDLKSGSKLELHDLDIRDIRHVWLDLQGLGSWDYIMESIVNLITNGLKLKIADTIVVPIRKSVQEQLDSINVGLD